METNILSSKIERKCCICRDGVVECMGSVNAGDFVKAINGLLKPTEIRELCPKCATKAVNKELFEETVGLTK